MNAIAISRLVGSEAGVIARQVAEALGYDLVDKAILEGTLRQYGLTRFGEVYTSPPNLWDLANSKNLQVVSMLNDTMKALAHRGRAVILARGSYVTLNKDPRVLKVRLKAPFAVRVDRVMAREGIKKRHVAEEQVAEDDKARTKFVSLFYHHKWEDTTEFDLVVDTSVIPAGPTANCISEAVRAHPPKDPGSEAKAAGEDEVDPALLDAIEQALLRRV